MAEEKKKPPTPSSNQRRPRPIAEGDFGYQPSEPIKIQNLKPPAKAPAPGAKSQPAKPKEATDGE